MADTIIHSSKGRAVQLRAARSGGLTSARRGVFLDTLAMTANVRSAAAAAGVSVRTAYTKREKDAEFRAAWTVALEAGYARLEEELLALAMGDAATGYVPGGEEAPKPFNPALAMQILRMRDAQAKGTQRTPVFRRAALPEARRQLCRRLDALAKRLGNDR